MDFYITKEEVVKSINLTLGVVEKRQTLPILSNILFEVESHKKVVIHCNAGLGRTGMVAGLLLKKMGLIAEPIKHIRKFRPGSIETHEQETFVNNF